MLSVAMQNFSKMYILKLKYNFLNSLTFTKRGGNVGLGLINIIQILLDESW